MAKQARQARRYAVGQMPSGEYVVDRLDGPRKLAQTADGEDSTGGDSVARYASKELALAAGRRLGLVRS